MRSNPFFPLFLALLIIASPRLAHSQVEAAAVRKIPPFSVGLGASGFNVDWNHSKMYAATLWIDWHPARIPSFLEGLGVEVEGHHLNYGRPSTVPSNFRQDTVLGGPIYSLPRFSNFRPYVKFLPGFGSFDFGDRGRNYTHDTRTLYEAGAGFDCRVWNHVLVRAEYSYQDWGSLFNGKNRNPRGISVGAMYDFRILRPR